MRIAVVSWNRRKVGGTETYLDFIIQELLKAGHQVAFWHENDEPITREQIALTEETPTWHVAQIGADKALAELRRWSPDVIFSHGLLDPRLEAATLEIAPGIFFGHGYYGTCISGTKTWSNPTTRPCNRTFGPLCFLHFYPHRCGGLSPLTMLSEYRRQAQRLELLHRYRYVLTGSEHMRAEYAKHGLKARLVPLFVPPYSSSSDWVASPSHWRILFMGRMDRLKGGLTLLESLPKIREVLDRPLHVTFAGDGPDRTQWEHRATSVKAAFKDMSFDFPGWVTGDDLESLLAGSDLLVMPSLWPEPFGLSGPQAGLRGVPAAAFAVGGISDWLKDGVNGFLAPADPPTPLGLAEAVIKCFRDKALYLRLRQGAVSIAQSLSASDHVSMLIRIFEEVTYARIENGKP
jgi:glycosyltransferase involved in cell wall biosynthesis